MPPEKSSSAASPIQVRGLDHVVIRVVDLPRALAFYTDALGFPVERRLEELGLVQLRAGASLIDLVGIDTPLGRAGGEAPEPNGPNMDHFAIALDRFDETEIRAHLAKHGIETGEAERRYGALGFGPSIYLRDPEGNTVELKGPPETDGDRAANPS